MKIIATNRKAKRDYEILEKYEAGIELKGMEVKSLRVKGSSIDESFVRIERGEAVLFNMFIQDYLKASYFKLDTRRPRRLLLHKKEIIRLLGQTTQKRLTIIPLKIFFNQRGIVKLEIALARGKRLYDKRKKIKDEITKQEAERAIKRFHKYGK